MISPLLLPIFPGVILLMWLLCRRTITQKEQNRIPALNAPIQKKVIGEFGITFHCLDRNTYMGIYTIKLHLPLPPFLLYSIRRLILNDLYRPLQMENDFRFQQVGDQLAQLLKNYASVQIDPNLTEPTYNEVMEYMPNVNEINLIIDVNEPHRNDLTILSIDRIEPDIMTVFRSLSFLE